MSLGGSTPQPPPPPDPSEFRLAQFTPQGNLLFGTTNPDGTFQFDPNAADAAASIQESDFSRNLRLQNESIANVLAAQAGQQAQGLGSGGLTTAGLPGIPGFSAPNLQGPAQAAPPPPAGRPSTYSALAAGPVGFDTVNSPSAIQFIRNDPGLQNRFGIAQETTRQVANPEAGSGAGRQITRDFIDSLNPTAQGFLSRQVPADERKRWKQYLTENPEWLAGQGEAFAGDVNFGRFTNELKAAQQAGANAPAFIDQTTPGATDDDILAALRSELSLRDAVAQGLGLEGAAAGTTAPAGFAAPPATGAAPAGALAAGFPGNAAINQAVSETGGPLPFNQRPVDAATQGRNDITQALFEAQMSLLRPELAAREETLRQDLANRGQPISGSLNDQGVFQGTGGGREFNLFNQGANRAIQQAALGSVAQGADEFARQVGLAQGVRGQLFGERQAQRNQIFNELQARLGQQQVLGQPPAFQLPNPAQSAQAAQAAQLAQYQAATQQAAANTSGTFGLLGALGAAGIGLIPPSDRRLKDDIKQVGQMDDGTPVYTFTYKNDPQHVTYMGVMAQDIVETHPEAIHEIDGFMHVDYGAL